jgi:hypothetical protein
MLLVTVPTSHMPNEGETRSGIARGLPWQSKPSHNPGKRTGWASHVVRRLRSLPVLWIGSGAQERPLATPYVGWLLERASGRGIWARGETTNVAHTGAGHCAEGSGGINCRKTTPRGTMGMVQWAWKAPVGVMSLHTCEEPCQGVGASVNGCVQRFWRTLRGQRDPGELVSPVNEMREPAAAYS